MHDYRSGWGLPAVPDEKVVALPLQQETSDCEGEQLSCEGKLENESDDANDSSDRQLQQWIGNLLQYAVILACAVVFTGGALYLIRHGTELADYRLFKAEPDPLRSPMGMVEAVLSGRPRGIIQLGLMLSIATPIIRVAFSLLTFLWRQDFTYVTLTAIVLCGLIYSLIGAYL